MRISEQFETRRVKKEAKHTCALRLFADPFTGFQVQSGDQPSYRLRPLPRNWLIFFKLSYFTSRDLGWMVSDGLAGSPIPRPIPTCLGPLYHCWRSSVPSVYHVADGRMRFETRLLASVLKQMPDERTASRSVRKPAIGAIMRTRTATGPTKTESPKQRKMTMRGKITTTTRYPSQTSRPASQTGKQTGYQKGMDRMTSNVMGMRYNPHSLTCFYPECPMAGRNFQHPASDAKCPTCGRPMYASHSETIRV